MSEAILVALIAGATSSGICSLAIFLIQRRDKKKGKQSAESKMILGLGHDRIVYLGGVYAGRGYITQDEYENLHDYLFVPYEEMGGNGTASRVMREVEKLPIRK